MDAIISVKGVTEREQCDHFMRGLKNKNSIAQVRAVSSESLITLGISFFYNALAFEFARHSEISAGVLENVSRYNNKNYVVQPIILDATMHRDSQGHYNNNSNRNNHKNNKNNNQPRDRRKRHDSNFKCLH